MPTQTYNQIGRGLGSFFAGDGGIAAQKGQLAGLQQEHLQSQIAGQQAKAAADAEALAQASPDATLSRVAMSNGVPLDQVPTLGAFFKTGNLPFAAPNGGGALMDEPKGLNPDLLTAIGKQFADARMIQGGDAKSLNDLALSRATNQETASLGQALAGNDLVRYSQLQNKNPLTQVQSMVAQRIANGELSPSVGGQQIAASDGKSLVDSNEFGVTNRFTGAVDASGIPAQNFAQYRAAQVGAQKANAVQSYASADSSRAAAAKTRSDMNAPQGQYDASRGIIIDPRTGQAVPVTLGGVPVGAVDKGGKPLTEGQGKALLFGSRMQQSGQIISQLEDEGVKTPSLIKQGLEGVPMVGGALGVGANVVAASSRQQQVEQAQRDFVNAVLRRESGAAISPGEFASAQKQYFAQPGDGPQVLAQKRQNRELATRGLMAEAGSNAPDIIHGAGATRAGATTPNPQRRTVVRTGTANGRKVVQYSDGTTDYAD